MELIPLRELQYVDVSYNDIEKYLLYFIYIGNSIR